MRPARDDASEFLSRIVPYVEIDGARNLNKISQELQIPYQTLRFRMMHLQEAGITVQPIVDQSKLGLERFRASFRLSNSVKEIKSFFGGLHQSAGLRYYSRSLYDHTFDCEFALPRGEFRELQELFAEMQEMQLISNVEVRHLLWKDVLMLNTRFFDYSKNEWDVDFSTLTGDPSLAKIPGDEVPVSFDYTDLLIIKDFELDPWAKIVDTAKRINVPDRDAAYHLNRHILGKRLISSFRFKWIGTRDAWLKHSIIGLTYIFKDLSDSERNNAMSILTSSPFTWCHMGAEDGTYMAEVMFPVAKFSELNQFVSGRLGAFDLSPEVRMVDWTCSSSFTIPYMLFDKDRSVWRYNAKQAIEYTLQMIKAYPV